MNHCNYTTLNQYLYSHNEPRHIANSGKNHIASFYMPVIDFTGVIDSSLYIHVALLPGARLHVLKCIGMFKDNTHCFV